MSLKYIFLYIFPFFFLLLRRERPKIKNKSPLFLFPTLIFFFFQAFIFLFAFLLCVPFKISLFSPFFFVFVIFLSREILSLFFLKTIWCLYRPLYYSFFFTQAIKEKKKREKKGFLLSAISHSQCQAKKRIFVIAPAQQHQIRKRIRK